MVPHNQRIECGKTEKIIRAGTDIPLKDRLPCIIDNEDVPFLFVKVYAAVVGVPFIIEGDHGFPLKVWFLGIPAPTR